jgi:RNA polymerase sigma factor (sigma-70 family)
MTNTDTASWVERLMADAAWTRRLAGALLGDADAAADAAQDVWLKQAGRPVPAVRDPRGWTRSVMANLLRDRWRGDQRRRQREVAAAATVEGPASPEELLGRLEVHRTLATLIAGLPEPGRQVVLLHYFEGMPLVEIASSTGQPPGTVRWRLKTALDELRAQLEKRYGDQRHDWRRALLPLLPAPRRTGAPLWIWPAAGLMVALGALSLHHARGPAAVSGPPSSPVGGGGPSSRPPSLAAAVLPASCATEVAVRRRELEAARAVVAYHRAPEAVWTEAAENPAARTAMAPLVERVLDERGAPRAGRTFECRGNACLAKVEEPWPPTPPWVQHHPSPAAESALAARARKVQLTGPEHKTRPVGVSPYAETTLWILLGEPSAQPVLPASLLPSATSAPDTAVRTAECRNQLAELERAFHELRRQAIREMPPEVLYQAEHPNLTLTTQVQQALARVHADAMSADCRGSVCRLAPVAPVEKSILKQATAELAAGYDLKRASFETHDGKLEKPGFVILVPREGRDGKAMLRFFIEKLDVHHGGKELASCHDNFAATEGVRGHFVLHAADEGGPSRITVTFSGPGAATPFGACVAEAIEQAAAAFPVPAGLAHAESDQDIDPQ